MQFPPEELRTSLRGAPGRGLLCSLLPALPPLKWSFTREVASPLRCPVPIM